MGRKIYFLILKPIKHSNNRPIIQLMVVTYPIKTVGCVIGHPFESTFRTDIDGIVNGRRYAGNNLI